MSCDCCKNGNPLPCGCCSGIQTAVPVAVVNRPGLPALRYRIGTHAAFFQSMVARLSSSGFPELAVLTTRELSDPSIALLDAWAIVTDVLTFYQERIANEGFLRTATERRSLVELARLVGYQSRPGVSASVYLAWTLENTDIADAVTPAGTRAQSIPGPGESAQTFETSVALTGRAKWSRIKPRLLQPQTSAGIRANGQVYLAGISTNLKANDALLLDRGQTAACTLVAIREVVPDAPANRTLVRFQTAPMTLTRVAVASAATRLTNLASFGIARNARGTASVLSALSALGPDNARPDGLSSLIAATIADVDRAIAALGRTRLQPRVSEWHAVVKRELVALAAAASTTGPDTAFNEEAFVTSMAVPSSVQPAASVFLSRSVKNSLSRSGDQAWAIVRSFVPRLDRALDAALANAVVSTATAPTVDALRVRAALFGHNHPGRPVYSRDTDTGFVLVDHYDAITLVEALGQFDAQGGYSEVPLDAVYEGIVPGSAIVFQCPAPGRERQTECFTVKGVETVTKALFGISTKVTVVELDRTWVLSDASNIHREVHTQTVVHAQSESLKLVDEPVRNPICGGQTDSIELDGVYEGLEPGRWVIVSGERELTGTSGVKFAERAMISSVRHDTTAAGEGEIPGDRNRTFITLAEPLAYCFRRDSAVIYANVVEATHGETRREVLGSGDGSRPLQSFTLKQPPLSYVSSATPSGIESTLDVFVNDVEWKQSPSLAGLGPNDRRFVTKTDDDGRTTVVFGNGTQGSRLPTGQENIRAIYRSGIGAAGNVRAGQISQPLDRPLGVREVINPLPASGGAEKETRDQMRKNLPLGALALDRLVSISDYADFSRGFAGVGKAAAAMLQRLQGRVVHVTIAGAGDAPIDPASSLYRSLRDSLTRFGDPLLPIELAVRELILLVVSANVRVREDYRWETVEPQVRAAMNAAFGFENRELGQPALLCEAIAAMQNVPGVQYVDVDIFGGIAEKGSDGAIKTTETIATEVAALGRNPAVIADTAMVVAGNRIQPARIAYLKPDVPATLILNEVTG